MSEVETVRLEWTYTPKSYLEDPILIQLDGGSLEIKEGQAIALLDSSFYKADTNITEKITKKIKSIFLPKLLFTHKDFKLSKPCRTDIRKDGKKNVFVEVELTSLIFTAYPVQIIVKDKDGNIVSDSKQERFVKQ